LVEAALAGARHSVEVGVLGAGGNGQADGGASSVFEDEA